MGHWVHVETLFVMAMGPLEDIGAEEEMELPRELIERSLERCDCFNVKATVRS